MSTYFQTAAIYSYEFYRSVTKYTPPCPINSNKWYLTRYCPIRVYKLTINEININRSNLACLRHTQREFFRALEFSYLIDLLELAAKKKKRKRRRKRKEKGKK